MEITVEMASKASREYGGRTKWGVHPKGAPKDYWVDIYVQDRPQPGQVFNIGAVKESTSKDGAKVFREAEIIGPAAGTIDPKTWPQAPLSAAPSPKVQPYSQSALNGTPGASSGKIKWDDWCVIAKSAHELALLMEQGLSADTATARVAFVNTTLIAFSNGKLELPTDAGPVSRAADPDSVLPPGWWETR
jgi:hypothetical protein